MPEKPLDAAQTSPELKTEFDSAAQKSPIELNDDDLDAVAGGLTFYRPDLSEEEMRAMEQQEAVRTGEFPNI